MLTFMKLQALAQLQTNRVIDKYLLTHQNMFGLHPLFYTEKLAKTVHENGDVKHESVGSWATKYVSLMPKVRLGCHTVTHDIWEMFPSNTHLSVESAFSTSSEIIYRVPVVPQSAHFLYHVH